MLKFRHGVKSGRIIFACSAGCPLAAREFGRYPGGIALVYWKFWHKVLGFSALAVKIVWIWKYPWSWYFFVVLHIHCLLSVFSVFFGVFCVLLTLKYIYLFCGMQQAAWHQFWDNYRPLQTQYVWIITNNCAVETIREATNSHIVWTNLWRTFLYCIHRSSETSVCFWCIGAAVTTRTTWWLDAHNLFFCGSWWWLSR